MLRGWAVALVVLDHFDLGPFGQGFLGVDVFFVISGFLITGILKKDIRSGQFSFREFYLKRARRILPAAYITIALTIIGSFWFLTSVDFVALRSQVLGAVTYTLNYVLFGQNDYFAVESQHKPLLHMWSLGVEEQFYLFFPIAMYLLKNRMWIPVLSALCIASFVGCLATYAVSPSAAFYFGPTRAWELLLGSLLALGGASLRKGRHLWSLGYWPSVAGLLFVPTVDFGLPHPGLQALLICICACVVILADKSKRPRPTWAKPLVGLGNISYSLYLVHWPLIVLVNSAYNGELPVAWRLMLISLSAFLAALLYLTIENPSRRYFTAADGAALRTGIYASVATIVIYFSVYLINDGGRTFYALRLPNFGLGRTCEFAGGDFIPKLECATSSDPEVLVWGDSFAMHLVPGMAQADVPLLQATASACSPYFGLATEAAGGRTCLYFNESVRKYLKENASLQTVVMASTWVELARNQARNQERWFVEAESGKVRETKADPQLAYSALDGTIGYLRALGRRVVLVAPPPRWGGRYK